MALWYWRDPSEPNDELSAEQRLFRFWLRWFNSLRNRRGALTAHQLKLASKLFSADAVALYDLANRMERGRVLAPSLKRPVDALAARLAERGLGNDAVVQEALCTVAETTLAAPKTVSELRAVAAALATASEFVNDTLSDYYRRADRERDSRVGRGPNAALDWLLDRAASVGFSDGRVARELVAVGLKPDGPGSDADDVQRWQAILKSARARRRAKAAKQAARSTSKRAAKAGTSENRAVKVTKRR